MHAPGDKNGLKLFLKNKMLKNFITENLYKWEKESLAPPTQISITPTNLCNLKCQSCWQRDKDNANYHQKLAEIPEENLLQVINEASKLGVRCIELTGGGEPLARNKTTVRLIKETKNKGMIGWMTSNGTLFSPEIIKLMVELKWDKLTISLDGPDAETNDFLRPPSGSFEKIINTLSFFSEYKKISNTNKPEITFNVVVSKYNIDKLNDIIKLASKFGVKGVTFEPIKVLANQCKQLLIDFEKKFEIVDSKFKEAQYIANNNNIFTNINGLVSTPELIRYSDKLKNKMPSGKLCNGENKLLTVPCIEPWFHLYLEADGNVRPCCVSAGLGENINHNSLRDIWFGDKFLSFRNAIINRNYPSSCNQCNANLICFSKEIQGLLEEKLSKDRVAADSKTVGFKYDKLAITATQKQLKILIADTAPLYPPLWGGPKRIWSLYSNFSQELFNLTYVGVNFRLGKECRYSFNKIGDNFKEILCALPPHYCLWNVFKKVIFKDNSLDLFPYLWMHTDWQFRYILNSQDANIVICSHPWPVLCLAKNNQQFFIYDAHNCEYLLMDQILGNHFLKGLVLRQVYKIEKEACKRSDLILACSENEKNDLIKLYKLNPDKIIIVTNGTTIRGKIEQREKQLCKEALKIQTDGKVVVFIGAYYKPNIDALKFIINKILPSAKDMKLIILGSVCDFLKDQPLPQNLVLLGKVSEEQLDTALKASDIAINPMFSGSGINIKMLDYMSYGLPIVSTECGARGIETDGKQPMILSSADNFAENLKILSNNSQLCEHLSEDSGSLVAKYYDWKMISNKLQGIILERMKHK